MFTWRKILRSICRWVRGFFDLLPVFARILGILLRRHRVESSHWNDSLTTLYSTELLDIVLIWR